ncbi:MAG: hypothetical protein ACUVQM_01330 [Candidatus Hadarchaeaceae archaeon]
MSIGQRSLMFHDMSDELLSCIERASGRGGAKIKVKTNIENEIVRPPKAEICIRRVLGILLILLVLAPFLIGLSILPVFGVFFLTVPIAVATGIYLLKSKRYRLAADVFLVLLGALMYAYFIPFIGIPPTMLKGFLLASYWSEAFPWVIFSLTVSKILILGSAVFLLAGDILVRSRAFLRSSKRGSISVVIMLAIFAILFGAPFLRSVVGSGSPQGTATTIGFGLVSSAESRGLMPFNIGFEDTSVNFDSESNIWSYQITARNQLSEDAEIVEIISLKQPSGGFNIFSEKRQLAPPFGDDIEVSGGEKMDEKTVVKPGSVVTLKISSEDPFLVISLVEKRVRYDIGFWAFADEYPHGGPAEVQTEVELEIVEALDPNVKVFLASAIPPTPDTFKTSFTAGEHIYPQEHGLTKGTRYGFRIVNTAGEVVVSLDLGHLEEVRNGSGAEGYGSFNSGEKPLPPGPYRMELIKVEGRRGFLVAYENFSVYSGS